MAFEPTNGKRVGIAVQRLDHLATLSLFFEKSQKLLSFLLLSFSYFCQIYRTSSTNWTVLTFVCCFFALFWTRYFLDTESVDQNECLSSIVFIFPVAVQNVSHRDGIRTHARKPYWSSSPTPQPLGHPVASTARPPCRYLSTKAKNCCLFCTSLFLCITKFVQHLRIRVCLPLSVVLRFFLN